MDQLNNISLESIKSIETADNLQSLEEIRIKYLGKKGELTAQMKLLGQMQPEERKTFGAKVNQVKQQISEFLDKKKIQLETENLNQKLIQEKLDISIEPREYGCGKIHPITKVIEQAVTIFASMGFSVKEGPEIEDDFHNFSALNIPPDHPARQMQDTFYLPCDEEGQRVLRTHTSSVQIRTMMQGKPPFKFIAPGRVYRSDYDITHTPMFHQIEGLLIDENINMGHLKGCLHDFLEAFFEIDNLPIRFRPSFFPFTEPSAEVDIGCQRKDGELTIGAGQDWLEILGCGMVHPNVLKNVNIDPERYQGFAFGLGVERLAMLKYGAPDLRNFFDGDIRWLNHYGFNFFEVASQVEGL